jgi:hypothetical protein
LSQNDNSNFANIGSLFQQYDSISLSMR